MHTYATGAIEPLELAQPFTPQPRDKPKSERHTSFILADAIQKRSHQLLPMTVQHFVCRLLQPRSPQSRGCRCTRGRHHLHATMNRYCSKTDFARLAAFQWVLRGAGEPEARHTALLAWPGPPASCRLSCNQRFGMLPPTLANAQWGYAMTLG
jgi:hypothetical protein